MCPDNGTLTEEVVNSRGRDLVGEGGGEIEKGMRKRVRGERRKGRKRKRGKKKKPGSKFLTLRELFHLCL